jgi:hypothetical protein
VVLRHPERIVVSGRQIGLKVFLDVMGLPEPVQLGKGSVVKDNIT